ncbi:MULTISPECIES: hypothetical protein [Arthrobacter]|nr:MULTISPECIES: hypothetical protein [Arthrobacter]
MATYTDELVLSSQNIILISKGMLGNTKGIEYFELNTIKNIGGKPQAIASGPKLDVYFLKGQDSFGFKTRREAKAWANSISKLLNANPEESGTARDRAIPGAAYVADTLRNTLGTFKDTFRRK